MVKKSCVKVGVIQLEVKIHNYEDNIKSAIENINECAKNNCDIVCLPEAFSTSLDLGNIDEIAETIPGRTSELLSQIAKRTRVYIIAGILEKSRTGIYSTAVLIDNNGIILGTYRRNYVYQLEQNFITSSVKPNSVFDTSVGRIGMIIGYDINFPESCRTLFKQNAEIIVCPSQIPITYARATNILAMARAIECNCYFLLVSSAGENMMAQFEYMGNSMIARSPVLLDPHSTDYVVVKEIMSQAQKEKDVLYTTLDLYQIRREQKKNPNYNAILIGGKNDTTE